MHIETLKTFCDLIESGSFTRAAQMNLVSQSAVSQQLKSLETRYDCRLLERNRRGRIVLTEQGKRLYTGCRELLDRFQSLELQVRERSTVIAGTVRVATVYSIGLHELPPYIKKFLHDYPSVNVRVEYRRSNLVYEDILHNSVDFGLVAFPVKQRQIEILPFRNDRLVLITPPNHPLAKMGEVSASAA